MQEFAVLVLVLYQFVTASCSAVYLPTLPLLVVASLGANVEQSGAVYGTFMAVQQHCYLDLVTR